MKSTGPRIPLWEEIYEREAIEFIKEVEKVLPTRVEIEGKNDNTFYEINEIGIRFWKKRILYQMPVSLRHRFDVLVRISHYYKESRLIVDWKLGKEYLHLRKKL